MNIEVYHPGLGKDRVVLMDEGVYEKVMKANGWKRVAQERKVRSAAKEPKVADNLTETEEV